ncbi:MAG: TPM domain-containing protein [Flavobacteriales bacterium]
MSSQRSVNAADFLSAAELAAVHNAVQDAELRTSAEVRVHLESHVEGDILDHAAIVFEQLGMQRTKHRNGVLIYVSVADRRLAVIGDKGIHERVGANFWPAVVAEILKGFKADNPAFGLAMGLHLVGEQLSAHFPREENDSNELSNEVSIG